MSNKSITVGDRTFNSLQEACDYYGVSKSTYYQRINSGHSIEEALGLVSIKKRYKLSREIEVNGVKYDTIKQACLKLNVSYKTVCYRLSKGYPLEKAFKKRDVFVQGEKFQTEKDACDYYNVNIGSVKQRKQKYGETLEESILTLSKGVGNEPKMIKVEGILYKSIREACKRYDLNDGTVRYRLNNGWSIEEAFELVDISSKTVNTAIIYNGMSFSSYKDLAEHYGVNETTLRHRVRLGYSLEEALNTTKKEISVEGRKFESVLALSNFYRLNYPAVLSRINNGWSIEEAVNIVPKCNNGIIDKGSWNQVVARKICLEILKVLNDNMYKCLENGRIMFYSKEELFEKFKEYKK